MPRKAAEIRGFQPIDTLYRKSDDKGLYLEIRPNSSKHWFLKYRIHGSEKRLSLGTWPEVSLAGARERRDDARKKIREGDDPLHSRKMEKIRSRLLAGNRFQSVAEDLIAVRFVASQKAEATIEKARWYLSHLTPAIGPDAAVYLHRTEGLVPPEAAMPFSLLRKTMLIAEVGRLLNGYARRPSIFVLQHGICRTNTAIHVSFIEEPLCAFAHLHLVLLRLRSLHPKPWICTRRSGER